MERIWIGGGALAGLFAVVLGALDRHVLPRVLDANGLELARVAGQLAAWHAPSLLGCGLWARQRGGLAHSAAAVLLAGLVLFCGGVLAIAFRHTGFGPAAPLGGTLLMLGWLLLAVSALRR